jgi:signal transduction histidine kinase
MARGDRAPVSVGGAEELASLGRAFNAMAEALDADERAKRDLVNDIAHELRTPLTNLRCHLEALHDAVVPVAADTFATLHAEVVVLQRLVEDLGLLSQAEARQLPLNPEAVDAAAIADGLVRELSAASSPAGVRLVNDVHADLPRAWFDPGRLAQVLRNLLDNAVRHSRSGGIVTIRGRQDGAAVVLEVEDTGEGIAPKHLPHVFDRFYRVDSSRSRQTGGSGLGLAIARQIVMAGQGTIDVSSEIGRGTTFRVTLPAAGDRL